MSDIQEQIKLAHKKAKENDIQILSRWQDPTIDDLIKENLELKRKLGEADEAVEYWQIECDKRNKVLDKIKEYIKENTRYYDKELGLVEMMGAGETRTPVIYLYGLLELLEEIE